LKKSHTLIGVSHHVLKDYVSNVPFKGKRFVLYNFLPDAAFHPKADGSAAGMIKLVAVGNLKEAKNYHYLVQIVKSLPNVALDIYGTGPLESDLHRYITDQNLPVRLCGSAVITPELLHQYDFFIQASSHEGFGLSVIEAMAAGLPALLSDIPVFREITGGRAHFFPLQNIVEATLKVANIISAPYPQEQVNEAFNYAHEQYCAARYCQQLVDIYQAVVPKLSGLI
jgi:glycosyltransferase involved in cell wall biosynthesis